MKKHNQSISREMHAAVTDTEGIIRVIAGAGTGKTTVLHKRIIHLCENVKVKAEDILCVSFTNKAVSEIKRRIPKSFYNCPRYRPFIGTFHSFSAFYLNRNNMARFNFPENFNILSDFDSKALEDILNEELHPSPKIDWQECLLMIEKRKMSDHRHYIRLLQDPTGESIQDHIRQAQSLFEKAFYQYLLIQRKNNIIDFCDILCFMLYLLEDDTVLREELQQQYRYILIDEFQDISAIEFAIIKILAQGHGNLFCVGDPDQCIYGFRGSQVEYIVKLQDHFPNVPVKTIVLTQNYRCTQNILDTANRIISRNQNRYPKQLFTQNPVGNYVYARQIADIRTEAQYIARDIGMTFDIQNALNKFCSDRKRASFQSTAILVRTSWQLKYLKDALNAENIISADGSTTLLESKAVRDLIAWLKFLFFHDDISLKRIINQPHRGIGRTRWALITDYAKRNRCLYYTALCDLINIDPRFQDPEIIKFRFLAEQLPTQIQDNHPRQAFQTIIDSFYGHTDFSCDFQVKQFLSHVESWYSQSDQFDQKPLLSFLKDLTMKPESIFPAKNDEKVQLLTIHQSKGMEFATVYVAGLNSGLLPSERANTPLLQEEERRLMYVACTRARYSLVLSSFITGSKGYAPSEYLSDLADSPAVIFGHFAYERNRDAEDH